MATHFGNGDKIEKHRKRHKHKANHVVASAAFRLDVSGFDEIGVVFCHLNSFFVFYRLENSTLIISVAVLFLIGLITTTIKVLQAVRTNPVKLLRTE